MKYFYYTCDVKNKWLFVSEDEFELDDILYIKCKQNSKNIMINSFNSLFIKISEDIFQEKLKIFNELKILR